MVEQLPLLEAMHIQKKFLVRKSIVPSRRRYLTAVNDVSLSLHEGEIVGLVGESGCGKSTFGRCILNLYPITSGKVTFRGEEISHLNARQMLKYRKDIQMIFQDPYASLNPRMSIFDAVMDSMHMLKDISVDQRKKAARETLDRVGISSKQFNKYPHEMSGGQRQRIVIARAMVINPSVVVCDEPVSALDVSVRSQVLNLMRQLQKERKLAYLFISHDLSVVQYLCDKIMVMYLGKVVEQGTKEDVFRSPQHPYTKALLSAIPIPDIHKKPRRILLQGDVPSPIDLPRGCCFHTRCPYATERCKRESPQDIAITNSHFVACHLVGKKTV